MLNILILFFFAKFEERNIFELDQVFEEESSYSLPPKTPDSTFSGITLIPTPQISDKSNHNGSFLQSTGVVIVIGCLSCGIIVFLLKVCNCKKGESMDGVSDGWHDPVKFSVDTQLMEA